MTSAATYLPQRRGACPGLSVPMPSGDGLLARLRPSGTISLLAFAALCAAAREFGNGVIEITGRGSIQIRGLTAASAPLFADSITALAIAADDGVPVHTDALAGLDAEEILDAGSIAADLRRTLAHTSLAERLAPKAFRRHRWRWRTRPRQPRRRHTPRRRFGEWRRRVSRWRRRQRGNCDPSRCRRFG